jgi:hypothetical protein
MDDIDKFDATLERLEAERERRLAERIEAGEVVRVPLYIVAGSESEARTKVEGAKADKLAELRAAGDLREVVFEVVFVVTGVVKFGEATDEPPKPMAPPSLPSRSPAVANAPGSVANAPPDLRDEVAKATPKETPAPIIETYIAVQIGQCQDDDDPGTIAEGWFSVDDGQVIVTNASGKLVGSHALLKGEDARVVAKKVLREKAPEGESFNRRLAYPDMGLA